MTELTIDDATGVVRQDGQTPQEWLASLFEFEFCAECGWDADKHTVCLSPLGHFFARCDDPLPDGLDDAAYDALFGARVDAATGGAA